MKAVKRYAAGVLLVVAVLALTGCVRDNKKTTQTPSTHAPTTQAPTTQMPSSSAPVTQAPTAGMTENGIGIGNDITNDITDGMMTEPRTTEGRGMSGTSETGTRGR